MGGRRMSSSVPQSLAHTNVGSSSTAMTAHPLATSSNMSNLDGAMQHMRLQKTVNMQMMLMRALSNLWQHREQSQPHLIEKVRVKSTIGIVSTPRWKQSKLKVYIPFQILFNCQFQGRNCSLGFRECSPIQDCWRPGFLSLMKTGRPEYYIPSATTVSRDIRIVFAQMHARIGQMLQVSLSSVVFNLEMARDLPITKEHAGHISFATNAWTLPIHLAYITITAHLEIWGEPICIVLHAVELPVVRWYLIHHR